MPSLREIVQQRARVPAKIHDMEVGAAGSRPPQNVVSAPAPSGGPRIVEYSAGQVAEAGNAAPSGSRPPRPVGKSGNVIATPVASPLRKASEGRQPRSGSEPSRRRPSPRVGGNQSEVGQAASEDAGDNRSPVPRAKARSASVRARMSDAAPPIDRNAVGKVPVYLRRRQEEAAAEKLRAARTPSPVAPPGYRKVPDAEKQATLAVLRQRKAEAEAAQRKLPFNIETAGQKQREKQLADRISHLDKLVGMFAQPVVFIPADAAPIAMPPLPPTPQAAQPSRELGVQAAAPSKDLPVQAAAPRPPRIREDGPALSENSHESVSSRHARGRSEGGDRDEVIAPRRPLPVRQGSDDSHVRPVRVDANVRERYSEPPPWDVRSDAPSNAFRTGVKVVAPPGGVCSLSLHHH